MKKIRNICSFFLACTILGCSSFPVEESSAVKSTESLRYKLLFQDLISNEIDSLEHFRGLEIIGNKVFVSGSKGNVLYYDLDNKVFQNIFSSERRHFRDVDVLSNGDIVVLAITNPAEIWLKKKDADSFKIAYSFDDSLAFLDGVDFWDENNGLAFGDAIDGYPLVLRTEDGGFSWVRLSKESFPEESHNLTGFAASGTSIFCGDNGLAMIGSGGKTAKFLRSDDYGANWDVISAEFMRSKEGVGIYSLTFQDDLNGVAVGGCWENTSSDSSKLFTIDGGKNWSLSSGVQDYRSCVTYFKDDVYLSTGTSGTDISYDSGRSWELLDSLGFNAIAVNDSGLGIAVSNRGVVKLFNLESL